MKLLPINRLNWRRCLGISARDDQMPYVADYEPVALVILAKCFVRPQERNWLPFAFEVKDQIVGVCALSTSDHGCELFHFLIDKSVQQQGHGRAALSCIIEYVRREFVDHRELLLTVHPDNEAAQSLYASAGFEKTTQIRDGEHVWRLAMAP